MYLYINKKIVSIQINLYHKCNYDHIHHTVIYCIFRGLFHKHKNVAFLNILIILNIYICEFYIYMINCHINRYDHQFVVYKIDNLHNIDIQYVFPISKIYSFVCHKYTNVIVTINTKKYFYNNYKHDLLRHNMSYFCILHYIYNNDHQPRNL